MDEKERQELIQIGYTIQRCCGNCLHGLFSNMDIGTCDLRGEVHRFGYCEGDHVVNPAVAAELGSFRKFLEEK